MTKLTLLHKNDDFIVRMWRESLHRNVKSDIHRLQYTNEYIYIAYFILTSPFFQIYHYAVFRAMFSNAHSALYHQVGLMDKGDN